MRDLTGKVAVVTGAASGIGFGLAERLVGEGMRVAIADVEEEALGRAVRQLEGEGGEVMAVPTDVSVAASVDELARRCLERFGAVHVVCNNAGVGGGGLSWDIPLSVWEWVLGVNLWGVIHGVEVFVPHLIQQGGGGHILNTASMAGFLPMQGFGIYVTTTASDSRQLSASSGVRNSRDRRDPGEQAGSRPSRGRALNCSVRRRTSTSAPRNGRSVWNTNVASTPTVLPLRMPPTLSRFLAMGMTYTFAPRITGCKSCSCAGW